ncbi:MAG: CubicO group peptidase (beta-lactamase class C family) [Nitriliruptoraceae bacterium]
MLGQQLQTPAIDATSAPLSGRIAGRVLGQVLGQVLGLVPDPVRSAMVPLGRHLNPWRLSTLGAPMRVPLPDSFADVTTIDRHLERPARSLDVSPKAVARIWRSVEDQYRTGLHPGLSLVIRRRGELLMSRGIGMATGFAPEDEEPAVPMTARTPLCLYSGSKAFTAMILHRLAEDGVVDLDGPVTVWIPEFGQNGKDGISVRHLMTHRAGISRMPMKVGDDADRLLDHDTVLARLCASPADTRPGASQAYHAATSGYILGEVAIRAGGASLNELLARFIAEPLRASALTYGYPSESPHVPARSAVTGPASVPIISPLIDNLLGMPSALVTPIMESAAGRKAVVPAGNLYASAEDANRFFEAMRLGGSWDGGRIVGPDTVADAIRPAGRLVIDGSIPAPIRFSSGFMLNERGVGLFGLDAPRAFGHLGFTNILLWADPDRSMSVALCSTGKSIHPASFAGFAASIATISATIPKG